MIKSAAFVKVKTLTPGKELRMQKRKLKKSQAIERKATKQVRPSPIGRRVRIEEIETPIVEPVVEVPIKDDSPPTRDEMVQRAEAIGLKIDKRWSDATLLKNIEG
jgi:hypothetical protein